MAVDPQLQPLVDLLAAADGPPLAEIDPTTARSLMTNLTAMARVVDLDSISDRALPGPGGEVPVRIYTPPGDGPFPVLVWCHGGGWVLGSIDEADPVARALCVGAECVVVSVGYRLAPEHPFPAGLEDTTAAVRWVAENAGDLNADSARLAVGGDSAGGNLAAATCGVALGEGGPAICFQLLVYPVVDFDTTTRSMVDNAEGYLLTAAWMAWFYDHYTQPAQRSDPLAAPLRSADLSGLPPALVITAEYDPLRDEGEAYGRRLTEAGVPTVVSRYDGMIHGFLGMTAYLDRAADAEADAVAALRQAFRT